MGAWGACPATQYGQAVGILLLPTAGLPGCSILAGVGKSASPPMNPPRGGLVAPKDGNCCFGKCLVPELGMSERLALPPTSPPIICRSAVDASPAQDLLGDAEGHGRM